MMQKILGWMKKHYIISFILVCAVLWGMLPSDKKDEITPIQEVREVVDTWVSAESIEEIIGSKYSAFFDKQGFNIELKKRIQEESSSEDIEILRAKYFTTDDKKQILVTTYYTLDWVEYASNSRHNIETNLIEEFYSNEVK